MEQSGATRREIIRNFGRVAGVSGAYAAMQAFGLVADAGPYRPAPAPSPRFSRTEAAISHAGRAAGADTEAVLASAGFSTDEIRSLKESGAVATS